MPLHRVSVLGGTDPLARAEFLEAAAAAGRVFASQGITVLYDGGSQGPIGELVAAFQSAHGTALQVPAEQLGERTDGILALPAGVETLEQLLEKGLVVATGVEPPFGLLNTGDYFSGLLEGSGDGVLERFVRESQRGRLIVQRDPVELLRTMAEYRPPETRRLQP
jgi:predicted Rossmann-fold nucleotide-binding protein